MRERQGFKRQGFDRPGLQRQGFAAKAADQRVTLSTKSEERCQLLRKATRDVPSDSKLEHKSSIFGTSETRVVTTVHGVGYRGTVK